MARLSRPSGEEGVSPHTSLNRNASITVAIPDVSQDLLDYLETMFPDRINAAWRTIEEVREAIGARNVIDHLRRLHQEQEQSHVHGGQ